MSGISPEPWDIQDPRPIPGHDYTIVSGSGEVVASVRTGADALLIANAPILLDAVKTDLEFFRWLAKQTFLTGEQYAMLLEGIDLLQNNINWAEGNV